MKKTLYFIILALLTACTHTEPEKELSDYSVSKDTITINSGSPIISKIRNEKVSARSYLYQLSTSGTVQAIPNNYALIAAPFSGRITKSFVKLGQNVKAGDPIFEISSPSYFDTGKAYYQSKEEMDLALKNLNRQKDLLAKGVGVQKELEEAEVNYALKKKDYENALASLKVYQVDPEELVLGQPLIVRSPINGTVVENRIVIGLYLREDSEPVATVAELSKVWIAGQVKEKDIRFLNNSVDAEIRLIAFPEDTIKGRIYHIKSIIDEETRSVQVLIECDNRNMMMKPGMFVTAIFSNYIHNAIVIPAKSVFQRDDESYVFVHVSDNKYIKRKIETLTSDRDSMIVKNGISAGEEIVVNGGFYMLEEK